jgi:hypothetical protein
MLHEIFVNLLGSPPFDAPSPIGKHKVENNIQDGVVLIIS